MILEPAVLANCYWLVVVGVSISWDPMTNIWGLKLLCSKIYIKNRILCLIIRSALQ